MENKDKLKLDTLELASRMRGPYQKRSLLAPKPRSTVAYLRKQVGADIWEPVTQTSTSSSLTKIKPQTSNVKKFYSCQPKINQTEHLAPLESVHITKKVNQNSSNEQIAKVLTSQKINFNELASQWKQNKQARFSIFNKPRHNLKVTNYMLYGMAVVVFVVGILASLRSFMVDHKIAQTVSAQSVTQEISGNEVDEAKPTDQAVKSYSVAPDMPRLIKIPKLQVNARIRQLAEKKDGSLNAPGNIFDVGWYSSSAKPGSPGGASIFDGHVSGPTQKGVFYKLDSLKAGDLFSVELGDGTNLSYKVVEVSVVKATDVDMSKMLLPITPGTHGLNLITCTGKFDSATKTYQDRVLVFAQIVK